jgi:hypothetical protein
MDMVSSYRDVEEVVADSIRAAIKGSDKVLTRRRCNSPGTVPSSLTQAEKVGIFVTCLRSELVGRYNFLPIDLREKFNDAKLILCNTDNWTDVGVFGQAKYEWKTSGNSSRTKKIRLWESENAMDRNMIGQIAAAVKQEEVGFNFELSFRIMDQLISDMNRNVRQQECINSQATQIAMSLCDVAESLVQPVYE